MKIIAFFLLGALGIGVLVVAAMFISTWNLWLRVKTSSVPLGLLDLIFMKLRRVDPLVVAENMIAMHKSGVYPNVDEVETHVLCGGDVDAVADALIRAKKADIEIDFPTLAAIDLAGRDVVEAVDTHVNPKVLTCPSKTAGFKKASGVAKDGVRVSADAKITVRTQVDKIVGAAGEETLMARVGEGIVSAISRADSHRDIVANPGLISEYILNRGLDSGTYFEIVSVDIGNVDVEKNIGAELREVQASADEQVAQARAEGRRALAVAQRAEMQARIRMMQSRYTSAKSLVPNAVASSFSEGNVGKRRPFLPTVNSRLRWQMKSE
jgi:uncharacterized protein YqfA (UPF0365 family)